MRFHRPALLALAALAAVLPLLAAADDPPAAPATPDTARVALGASTYRSYCATCHGLTGHGDGPVAELLRVPPADLTTIAARAGGDFPFEAVHRTIDGREVPAHGPRDMPIWGDAFRVVAGDANEAEVTEKITDLVHFVWSLQETAAIPATDTR